MFLTTKYTEMKESGIPWLGKYPAHWKCCKVKNVFFSTKTIVGNKVDDYERLALTLNGVIKRSKVDTGGLQPEKFETYQILRENELVFKLIDLQNVATSRVGRSPYTGIVSPAYIILHERNDHSTKYAEYYFLSMWMHQIFNQLGADGVRSNIGASALLNIPFLLPPKSEQKNIAAFLDTKITQINSIIYEAKASIEEYKAWKASIIYEAVTKGLDSDVEMKDSGLEWIGDIPTNWDVMKLKNIISFIESGVSVNAAPTPANDDGIGVLKTSSVSKYAFRPEENKEVNVEELNRVSCPVKGNTIIVSRMNTPELVGACGFIEHDWPNLFLPDRLWQVHFVESVNVKYVWYYLCSNYIKSYYASLSSGTSSSMQNISQGQFENAHLVLPPHEIQRSIVNHLDKKCSTIDSLISEKEMLIADLEAYKKSLIFEIVTGKRKV